MKHLQVLLAQIMAALARGGSGAARQEAQQEVVRMAKQGTRMALEMIAAMRADFARHFEDWFGVPPIPATPREDPHHAALARMGWIAVWFLLALKAVFWTVFGPSYFNVLPWLAVIIALCVSIPLSVGIKPLIARLILKPDLTRQQQERRLHRHVLAGIIAFGIVFGGLFLLRGLVGSLALIGALLVLPVLSLCDMVLLYLMGVADAYVHLYSWAAPFVEQHQVLTAYLGQFEHHAAASRQRLGEPDDDAAGATAPLAPPLVDGPAGVAANPTADAKKPAGTAERRNNAATAAALILATTLLGTAVAHAQTLPPTEPVKISSLNADSTTSIFPTITATMGPIIAQSFTIWTEQIGAHVVRVSTFERDGWLPRTILQTTRNVPTACAPTLGERAVFKGMSDALEQQARDACNHAREQEADRLTTAITNALTSAWHTPPIVDATKGHSCTAFLDALAAAARAPAGHLIVIVSDTEETCKSNTNPVPRDAAGADVIIILVPSNTDMGPGVSAADRFNAKKAQLHKIAPWLRTILAPADVESYRLPIPPPAVPVTRISFWQR
jgi:hypothetical protein